jgi:tRNA(adenine34) deaminase
MRLALEEAARAIGHGDVPIGALLLDPDGAPVAADHNRREELADATAHAEMLVLSARSRDLGSWRLDGHTLVVTLEPCAMCAGALINSRVDRLVFAARDPKAGYCRSLGNLVEDERLNHRLEVVEGVLAEEASALLREFFASLRRNR